MIWALILIGGAIYGATLLGTDNSFWGALLIGAPVFWWKSIYEGLGRFIWVGAGVVVVMMVIWLTNGKASAREMLPVFAIMALFPLALLIGFMVTKRDLISSQVRKVMRRIRS